jgi:hypothetical protein
MKANLSHRDGDEQRPLSFHVSGKEIEIVYSFFLKLQDMSGFTD